MGHRRTQLPNLIAQRFGDLFDVGGSTPQMLDSPVRSQALAGIVRHPRQVPYLEENEEEGEKDSQEGGSYEPGRQGGDDVEPIPHGDGHDGIGGHDLESICQHKDRHIHAHRITAIPPNVPPHRARDDRPKGILAPLRL